MNTNTHQETQALHAAVFTPAAATIAAYDLLLIPCRSCGLRAATFARAAAHRFPSWHRASLASACCKISPSPHRATVSITKSSQASGGWQR